jgi:hypothetical protein
MTFGECNCGAIAFEIDAEFSDDHRLYSGNAQALFQISSDERAVYMLDQDGLAVLLSCLMLDSNSILAAGER